MARPKKNNDPFADLDPDFKGAIDTMDEKQIRNKIAEVTKNEVENNRLLAMDVDVQEKRLILENLRAPYKAISKANHVAMNVAIATKDDSHLTQIVIEEAANKNEMREDQAIEEAKSVLDAATAQYSDNSDMNALRIRYALQALDSKGKI
ncbi:MAG: hypothetical protein NVS9B9_16520 [Ktedonobacteraceae bacterium]